MNQVLASLLMAGGLAVGQDGGSLIAPGLPAQPGQLAGIAAPPDLAKELLYSQLALAGSVQADLASSQGLQELNPFLGRGTFGKRQVAIGEAVLAGVVIFDRYLARRYPAAASALVRVNWVLASFHLALATHNAQETRGAVAGQEPPHSSKPGVSLALPAMPVLARAIRDS